MLGRRHVAMMSSKVMAIIASVMFEFSCFRTAAFDAVTVVEFVADQFDLHIVGCNCAAWGVDARIQIGIRSRSLS